MLEVFIKEKGTFYLMAALCVIGVIGKAYESLVYSKLLKAMENAEQAEHPLLKQLKLKYTSFYRIERKINNIDAFIETNLYRYKNRFIRLSGIHTINTRIMLLCIMVSCAGIAGTIHFTMDKWAVMYYVLAGALAVAGLELMDLQFGNETKRRYLFVSIKDYLENVLANQMENSEKELKELERISNKAEMEEKRTKQVNKQIAVAKMANTEAEDSQSKLKKRLEESLQKSVVQEKVIAEVIKEFL